MPQKIHAKSFKNIMKKQSKSVNLGTRIYLLINGLVRNIGITLPWDIFLCLIKYCNTYNDIKIWIFSWNMSSIKSNISINELKQIIPVDYDVYVFGIQEAVSVSNKKTLSNAFFDVVTAYLKQLGVGNKMKDYNYLKGLIYSTCTGVAVYCKDEIAQHISIHSKHTISDGIISSNKGSAGLILNIYSTKILLMSIDITDYNKLETFMIKCDKKVKKQYQHIICFGTFYNTYDIKSETKTQITKLLNGNALDIWRHDGLTQILMAPKNNNSILQNFKEPNPMINFYPTYPKHQNRKYDFSYESKTELYQVYQKNNKPISFCDRILYGSFDYFKQATLIPQINTLSDSFEQFSDNYNCISNFLMQSEHSPVFSGMILAIQKQMKKIKLTIHDHKGHYDNDDDYHPKNLLDGSNNTYYMSKDGTTSGDWIIFKMETNNGIKPTKIRIINSDSRCGICSISLFIGSNNNFFPLCQNILNIKKSEEPQEWLICDKLFLSDYFLSTKKLNLIKIKILNNHGSSYNNCFYSFDLFGVEYE
eukprot:169670_1